MPPNASRFSPVAVTIDVRLELDAGLEQDPALGEAHDAVGDDRGPALADAP